MADFDNAAETFEQSLSAVITELVTDSDGQFVSSRFRQARASFFSEDVIIKAAQAKGILALQLPIDDWGQCLQLKRNDGIGARVAGFVRWIGDYGGHWFCYRRAQEAIAPPRPGGKTLALLFLLLRCLLRHVCDRNSIDTQASPGDYILIDSMKDDQKLIGDLDKMQQKGIFIAAGGRTPDYRC